MRRRATLAWLLVGALALLGGPCNRRPAVPTVAITGTTETTISGTISACVDNRPENCQMEVRAVAQGGDIDDPPQGDGVVVLPTGGGAWTITGLQPSTTYTVIGSAFDGGKRGVAEGIDVTTDDPPPPPNQPPAPPTLSSLSATHNSISGSISACSDDGLPDPPGACTQSVLVVGQGGTLLDPPQGSSPLPLGPAGGPWTVTGLVPSTAYTVYGGADDGELASSSAGSDVSTAAPPNTAPNTPSISVSGTELEPGPAGEAKVRVMGTIDACQDDGLPNPPGQCTQTVLAIPSNKSCDSSCNCNATAVGDGEVQASGGSWEIGDLETYEEYRFYGKNSDGVFQRCSPALSQVAWATVPGCFFHAGLHFHNIHPNYTDTPSGIGRKAVRGARARWTIQNVFSADSADQGFTAQGLWVGIDEEPQQQVWIEVGVTYGRGHDQMHFYSALGDNRHDFYFEVPNVGPITTADPVIGQQKYFWVVNCRRDHSQEPIPAGCPNPYNASVSPKRFVACWGSGNAADECFQWDDAGLEPLAAGTIQYHEGVESTCAQTSTGVKSRVNHTVVTDSDFRYRFNNGGAAWVPVETHIVWRPGTAPRHSYVTFNALGAAPPDPAFELRCCGLTWTDTGSPPPQPPDDFTPYTPDPPLPLDRCVDADSSHYWLHSTTPTNTCN